MAVWKVIDKHIELVAAVSSRRAWTLCCLDRRWALSLDSELSEDPALRHRPGHVGV